MKRIVYFEKIDPSAITPTKAHLTDACWDIHSIEDVILHCGQTKCIRTGIRFEVLPGEKIHIYSRSGLAAKNSVYVLNAPGVIDATYTGEVKVILHNAGSFPYLVKSGDRIAQFSREIVLDDKLTESVVNTDTDRGEKGFGSSGF